MAHQAIFYIEGEKVCAHRSMPSPVPPPPHNSPDTNAWCSFDFGNNTRTLLCTRRHTSFVHSNFMANSKQHNGYAKIKWKIQIFYVHIYFHLNNNINVRKNVQMWIVCTFESRIRMPPHRIWISHLMAVWHHEILNRDDNNHFVCGLLHFPFVARHFFVGRRVLTSAAPIGLFGCASYLWAKMKIVAFRLHNELNELSFGVSRLVRADECYDRPLIFSAYIIFGRIWELWPASLLAPNDEDDIYRLHV